MHAEPPLPDACTGVASTPLQLAIDGHASVDALLFEPAVPRGCYVFAHGAGAGMAHPFMHAVAARLGGLGLATLRFQFPFMQTGRGRPDPPAVAQAAVRAAVAEAGRRLPGLPLVAGGKSFGGRMTSQAQAESPLPGVHGLAFLGFPLHPAKRPGDARAQHLGQVRLPMLFVQGTRDALADLAWMQAQVERLGPQARLHVVDQADHSFHVPVKSGRTDAAVLDELSAALASWFASVAAPGGTTAPGH